MKTFAIDTLGCKVNQYESQQVRQMLEELGLKYVSSTDNPDLSLINTCCVTATASSKSRQYIRKAKKQNPAAKLVAFGCLTCNNTNELSGLGSDLIIIKHRSSLASELRQIVLETESATPNTNQSNEIADGHSIRTNKTLKSNLKNPTKLPKLPQLSAFFGQTRAFLKVQDGCDNHCSYCIIPACRPKVQSKSVAEAVAEAQQLVNAGHKEIVVTGIYLGAFGQETTRQKHWTNQENPKLAELLQKLAQISGLSRIRLSSLAPSDVTEKLLDAIRENPNIMPHLHLSLQSGSDKILKRMCRGYTRGQFIEKVNLVKSKLKNPSITTDIIVGFPGETDEDFRQSLDLAKEAGFSRIHVFSFSARKGTAAAKMAYKVKPEVIKERAKTLGELAGKLAYQYRQQFIGEIAEVLIENIFTAETPSTSLRAGAKNAEKNCHCERSEAISKDSRTATGHSERYFEVQIPNTPADIRRNDIVKVTLTDNSKAFMTGQLCDTNV